MNKFSTTILALVVAASSAWAGNKDRQGEAGAYELLINPWARSAGLHTMYTSGISGVEAMQLNPAGISRIDRTEVALGHTKYLVGTGISMNSIGLATRIHKGGTLGLSLTMMNFGRIETTTVANPEGGQGTYSPNFSNIGVSYGYLFANKISVGATLRLVNESTTSVAAHAAALDAGVQYVTGSKAHPEQFKFGISLRSVGNKMTFRGEGLGTARPNPDGESTYPLTYATRTAGFNLPSQLNIGLSYDIHLGGSSDKFPHRVTILGNFVSNAFGSDNLGGGLEYGLGHNFALRAAYKYELGHTTKSVDVSVDTGLAAGFTFLTPFKRGSMSNIAIDYAWRSTTLWNGIHNLTMRINLGGSKGDE